ncbi:MAG TPA: iron ABC transporter permease, partial [Actinomycetota bacterium]|nr:iron ABC transporter permease [Actinomycetota bacterium]
MSAAPAAAGVRPMRLRPRLLLVAAVCLFGAVLVGVLVGPVPLRPAAVLRDLAARLPLVDLP